MSTRITILNELKEISPEVAKIPVTNPYQVPQGYFEEFARKVMMRIKTEGLSAKEELETISPLLSGLSKQMPFAAPVGYFKNLGEHAVAGAKAIEYVNVELENLSPMMSSLKSVNAYEVPAGYFESFAGKVLKNVRSRKPAVVISIGFGKKAMRYAAAAVITGLIALGGWLYFNPAKPGTTSFASIENKVKQVSDDEMLNFLENDEQIATGSEMSNAEQMDEADMKSLLANVSDEELEQFAKDNNEPLSN